MKLASSDAEGLACPACKSQAMSAFQKWNLGPAFSRKCRSCGVRLSVSWETVGFQRHLPVTLAFAAGTGVTYSLATNGDAGRGFQVAAFVGAGLCAFGALFFLVSGLLANARRARRYPLVVRGSAAKKVSQGVGRADSSDAKGDAVESPASQREDAT